MTRLAPEVRSVAIDADAASREAWARRRRRRRLVVVVGIVAAAGCFAMAAATQRRETPLRPAVDVGFDPRPSTRDAAAASSDSGPAAPPRVAAGGRRRPLRVRVVSDGVASPDAVVRAVAIDRTSRTVHALSDVGRTGGDGVVDLDVAEAVVGDPGAGCWLEVASASSRGLRHGYRPLPAAGGTGVVELALPNAGRLEVRVDGLPPGRMPEYIDVRFLTPERDWEEMFSELAATPCEDGGLFECKAIPRVERMRLRADGTGELPEVPDDHAIYVEFPATPDGWLVEKTTFSGRSMAATSGEVCRVAGGATGVYRVTYRRSPTALVRVVDRENHPVPGASVLCGLRSTKGEKRSRLFEAGETTDAKGTATVPLWTGSRLPDWSPVGLVLAAWADGRDGAVVETEGGWYGHEATLTLGPATPGSFVVEGTLKHVDGRKATGIALRLAGAPPWNGESALPAVRAVSDENGAFRLEVPESCRAIFAYGRRVRVAVDTERLDAQPAQALWRSRYPGLLRATTTPASLEMPAPGSTTRLDVVLEIPTP